MSEPPKVIGICPNRLGDSRYLTAAVVLPDDATEEACETCGDPLVIYHRVKP
jgi:hypothetical protein